MICLCELINNWEVHEIWKILDIIVHMCFENDRVRMHILSLVFVTVYLNGGHTDISSSEH